MCLLSLPMSEVHEENLAKLSRHKRLAVLAGSTLWEAIHGFPHFSTRIGLHNMYYVHTAAR